MLVERTPDKPTVPQRIGWLLRTTLPSVFLAALVGTRAPLSVGVAAPPPVTDPAELALRLVELLGDESFATREQATSRLIEIGWPARAALLAGKRHPDREIRYRCRRILARIDQLDFDRRLAAFATGHDDSQQPLPGWDAFRSLFGDSRELRSLFIRMQTAEPELLQVIQAGQERSATLAARIAQLQRMQRITRQAVPVPSVLVLLLAASDSDVVLDPATERGLASFCYQPELQQAAQDPLQRQVLRELLGRWLEQARGPLVHQALTLAMRFEVPVGLELATRVLDQPEETAAIRQSAILAILKLGDTPHQKLLESLLNDPTRCATQRVDNELFETQLRDVALAALLIMQDQDPRQFGFERLVENEATGFIPSTVGFANDQQREHAFDQWQAHRTNHPAPP